MKKQKIKSKSQKLILLFLIVFLGSLILTPLFSLAGEYKADGTTVKYRGLVPCGKRAPAEGESKLVTMPCQFCHFFVMFKGIFDFVLQLSIVIAILMFTIGGFLYIIAYAGPTEILPEGVKGGPVLLSRAKKTMTTTALGLLLIFAAWLIVNVVIVTLTTGAPVPGAVGEIFGQPWYKVNCPITIKR